MSEADDLGRGHAAQIGGVGDGGDEKSSPGTTTTRRKAAEDQTGAARPKTTTRRKAAEDRTGAARPKTTTRRKAAEDQTGAARPKTAARRKAAEDRTGAARPKTAARRRSTPATGSTLDRDLKEHAAETYTEAELEAGKKLAGAILSKAATSGGLAAMLSVLMPGASSKAGGGGIQALLSKLSETYADLSAQDQKNLRAVIAWVKSGFKLEPAS